MKKTENKLSKQLELGANYYKFTVYINKGYIEYVDTKEGTDNGWFLPNHSQRQIDNKRIVYDGSAKCEGKSLNDVIHPGLKLKQDLINVLLRFRRYPIALVCDISEMYLRIAIRAIDQPYHRIQWRSLKQN